ncbi:hypothetical protein [Streptomyces sp. SP18CS02]|uniref:hypothetical protein n=1 Tax=Streptomyces sp. SP18CS02 TaxID=3002531 RepID=UPI003FCCAF73
MDKPVAPVVLPTPRPAAVIVDDDQELVPEELTREQALDWHNRAAADHQLVFDHIDQYGALSAQRLFPRAFVAQVQRLASLGHLNVRRRPGPGSCCGPRWRRPGRTAAARRRSRSHGRSVVRRDGREPMGLGAAIGALVADGTGLDLHGYGHSSLTHLGEQGSSLLMLMAKSRHKKAGEHPPLLQAIPRGDRRAREPARSRR